MFWVGIIIALTAGLLSIGFLRVNLMDKFQFLREPHLDIALVVLLVTGLTISAITYLASRGEIKQLTNDLENEKATIRDLTALLKVDFSGVWSEPPYPQQLFSPVNHEFYVFLEKKVSKFKGQIVKFYATENYSFKSTDKQSAGFQSYQAVRPGEYPIGYKIEDLSDYDTVGIHIPFILYKNIENKEIIVERVELSFVLNGKKSKPQVIESPIRAEVKTYGKVRNIAWASVKFPIVPGTWDHIFTDS